MDLKKRALTKKLTTKERNLKMKDWPKDTGETIAWPKSKGMKKQHQDRFNRAWNE